MVQTLKGETRRLKKKTLNKPIKHGGLVKRSWILALDRSKIKFWPGLNK